MAKKKYYRRRKKTTKKQTKVSKEVKTEVARQLKKDVEVMYKRDPDFHSQLNVYYADYTPQGGISVPVHRLLQNFSPALSRGTSHQDFTGNKIKALSMSIFIRYIPDASGITFALQKEENRIVDFEDSDGNPINAFPQYPDVKVHIFRMDKDSWDNNISGPEVFCQRLDAVFKPDGSWDQDYQLSGGQEFIKSIKKIKSIRIKPKFRDYNIMHQANVLSTGNATQNGVDYNLDFSNGNGLQTQQMWEKGWQGQQCNTHIQCKIDDEILFNNAAGDQPPLNYVYAMFCQFTDNYQDLVFNEPMAPVRFDTRVMWKYTDA